MLTTDPAVRSAVHRDLEQVRAIARDCLYENEGEPGLKEMNLALKAMYAAIGRNLHNMRCLGPDPDPEWLVEQGHVSQ